MWSILAIKPGQYCPFKPFKHHNVDCLTRWIQLCVNIQWCCGHIGQVQHTTRTYTFSVECKCTRTTDFRSGMSWKKEKNNATKWISTSVQRFFFQPNNTNVSNHINICKCPANQSKKANKRFNAFLRYQMYWLRPRLMIFSQNRKRISPFCRESFFRCNGNTTKKRNR